MKNLTSTSRNNKTKVVAIALCIAVCGLLSLATNAVAAEGKINKILFLGNSITKHGPAPKIGWNGNWGMAASAPEKDYVHLVTKAIGDKTSTTPEVMTRSMIDFERKTASFEAARDLKKEVEFKPDMVILAVGENGGTLKTEEARTIFRTKLMGVLNAFKADNNPTIIIRSSFWPRKYKDPIFKEAAKEIGATFVDISALSKDESNYARSEQDYEHKGVAAHPGDKGMKAIADAIVKGIEKASN